MRRWILLGILAVVASWGAWILLQRHREAVERQGLAAWAAAYQSATRAFYEQRYPAAEKLLTEILPETERRYPKDHRLGDLLSMLGASYRLDGKLDQAEPILKRALEVYETISPSDPVGSERTEIHLASIYLDRQDYPTAEHYLSHALSISDKTPNGPAYERGNILLNLSLVRIMQGRFAEAEQLLTRSVEALTPISEPWAQTDLAKAFYQLGGVFAFQHRYPEAKQQYLKALKIQEKLAGPDSQEVSNTLQGLGEVYQGEGDTSNATASFRRAQEISRHSTAPGDDSRVRVLLGFGEAAENQGKYAQAESLYKQALDIVEKTSGPEHPDVALALGYLGRLYRDQQQFEITKADPLLKKALAIREKVYGTDHPFTAKTLSDLSLLSFYEHKFAEAERFAQRALQIQEKALGPDNLEVSTTLNRLGLAERDLRKMTAAETALKKALAIREKNLPPNHAWIAISLENLASVYMAQGEADKAAPLIKRAQEIRSHPPAG